MALARHRQHVAGSEPVQRLGDGTRPIADLASAGTRGKHGSADRDRVFAARVVIGDNGNIGKRYRRQDEIGTPLCIVIDFDSLKDQAVTVRHRDTMKQTRVKIAELPDALAQQLTSF